MSRFFSYPGSSPSRGDGEPEWSDWVRREPRFREFFANRKSTSHQHSGLDVGDDNGQGNALFRGEPARVVAEEYDQHRDEVHTIVQRSSRVGSGTTRVTWRPVDERRIEIVDTKAIHE